MLGFSGTLPATRAAIGELGPVVMGLGRALISMFLAFFAWYESLALGGIAAGGQMLLLQPLLSALCAALLLGESIAPRAWVAALLVLASVALSRWSQAQPRAP